MKNNWENKLTAFDAQLCKMVESLTERPCEPKFGGDHYFIEVDYGNRDPQFVSAVWLAIEGRAGARLQDMKDDPDRHCLIAQISFYDGEFLKQNPDVWTLKEIKDRLKQWQKSQGN